jgi:hypothetical protein
VTNIDERAQQLQKQLGEALGPERPLMVGCDIMIRPYFNAWLIDIPGAGVYTVAEASVSNLFLPSAAPPPPMTHPFDPHLPMEPQIASWTCAACALDWVLRATAIDPGSTRDQVVQQIGYPENINESYGLMDGSGSQLQRVLSDYGVASEQAWLEFDTVYALAQTTTGQMSGTAWYHWVALRGVAGDDLWIANSAPGYQGVYDLLSRTDWDRLGGFSVVWLSAP